MKVIEKSAALSLFALLMLVTTDFANANALEPIKSQITEETKVRDFTNYYDNFCENIENNYYDPNFGGKSWQQICKNGRKDAANARTLIDLARIMQRDTEKLGTSHNKLRLIPGKITEPQYLIDAINQQQAENEKLYTDFKDFQNADGITVFSKKSSYGNMIQIENVIKGSSAYNLGIKPGFIFFPFDRDGFADDKEVINYKGIIIPLELKDFPQDWQQKLRANQNKNRFKETFNLEPIIVKFQIDKTIHTDRIRFKDLDDNIMIVKFDSFNLKGLTREIDKYIISDNANIIIDLRHNLGGSDTNMIALLSMFFDKDTQLFQKQCRDKQIIATSTDSKRHFNGKVIILIGPRTTSAAELFSGIMQTKKRAIIMGENSSRQVMGTRPIRIEPYFTQYIPMCDAIIEGMDRLEDKGVTPDITYSNHIIDEQDKDKDVLLDMAIKKMREIK